jgi:hypothetical protein
MLRLSNDLGLLSEEYDVEHKRLIGNFPQAFSHLTLIGAARDISTATGTAGTAVTRKRERGAPARTSRSPMRPSRRPAAVK